jgi:hypothetical protein
VPSRVQETRGVPLWLIRDYLVEGGGQVDGDQRVLGDGWEVTLSEMDDFALGSLRIEQVRLDIEGTDDGLAQLWAFLEPKLLRAGG